MVSPDKSRDVVVKAGVVEDAPTKKVGATGPTAVATERAARERGHGAGSVVFSNIQRAGVPTQYDKDRALDQTVRDMIRRDVPAFNAIAARGHAVADPPPRSAVAKEQEIGPRPHVDFVDRLIDSQLGPVGGVRKLKPK
jgi:hypothetical protein